MVISEVNGKDPAWAASIESLQLRILPGDVPLPAGHGWWWLAFTGDAPVAFAALVPTKSTPGTAYLARAGVLPSARGQGLQLRLIRARERKAKILGFTRIVTDTYNNPSSANSLIKAGYRMFMPEYRWSFDGACYWQRNLNKKENDDTAGHAERARPTGAEPGEN